MPDVLIIISDGLNARALMDKDHLTDVGQGRDSPLGDDDVGDCTPCHGTIVDDIGAILNERRKRMTSQFVGKVCLANSLSAGINQVEDGALVRFYWNSSVLQGEVTQVQKAAQDQADDIYADQLGTTFARE